MNYTIIGAKGFIGGRIATTLQARGENVYLPGKDESGLFERDLGCVFYCAGLTADFGTRAYDTVEAHVALLSRLLARASFSHLVYLSSTRLYDSLGKDGGQESDAIVLTAANPRHLYDLSKALGENLVLNYSSQRGSVARLSCVYDWQIDAAGFLPDLLRRASRERAFSCDASTGAVRDYIHIDDVVSALLAIAQAEPKCVVNVASGENHSNTELVTYLNQLGWQIQLARVSQRELAPFCSTERLAALGVSPRPLGMMLEEWINTLEY